VPVLIGERYLLDLRHSGDAPPQPVIVSASVDWRLGTQRQKRLDRTAQYEVDGLDGAAGLFGEDHIETGHLVLGIGENRGAAGQELMNGCGDDQHDDDNRQRLQGSAY
jgi:hypothetical protein